MAKLNFTKCCVAFSLAGAFAYAQATTPQVSTGEVAVKLKASASSTLLRTLDSSLEAVVSKVSPAVVQIVVSGYSGPNEQHEYGGHRAADR